MNKQKVKDFVTAYSTAIGQTPERKNLLTELMENIIQKYEKKYHKYQYQWISVHHTS